MRNEAQQESNYLLLELIARYATAVIFNVVVKLATRYRNTEAVRDEAHRVSWEDNLLHVQNMVLNNCLSTVKHRTTYYPNRIKQLIGKLRFGRLSEAEKQETVTVISELIGYCRGAFTTLNQCASRQLEEVIFRRTVIPVSELSEAAEKYFHEVRKGVTVPVIFKTEIVNESAVGGVIQLRFLLENLVDEVLSVPVSRKVVLACVVEEDFVHFLFIDIRREKTREGLNQLFYPSLTRMTAGERGELHGTGYLICK